MKTRAAVALLAGAMLTAGCHDPSKYDLTEDQVREIISLEAVGPSSIPADGFTTTTLKARIKPANANNRTLFITTDRGTLLKGEGKLTDGALTVTAGPDGSVDFDLKSAKETGVATLVVTAGNQPLISASATISFEAANPDDTVRFIAVPTSLPADGASQGSIEVQLNTLIPAPSRTAAFESTLGSFIPTTKLAMADALGVARISLKSDTTIGTARLTVTAESVVRQTVVEFVRALPMTITVASPLTVPASATGSIDVTGQLRRTPGSVSDGTAVLFEAIRTDNGASIGSFRNITSSVGQQVSASFLPGTTDYRGNVELRVSLPDRSVAGSTTVMVVAPPP